MVQWSLKTIIFKGLAMPDTIGLVHLHVVHLNREPNIEGRVPGFGINIRPSREDIRFLITILNTVNSGSFYGAEVKFSIVVTQVITPFNHIAFKCFNIFSIFGNFRD
jgi:hypothetical protein